MAWIGQKQESEPSRPTTASTTPPTKSSAPANVGESRPMDNLANIGKSLQVKGELTGNEDLTIEGKVDGKIYLKDHKLTIGPNGRVKADVQAKSIVVAGKLDGNVAADDRVEITATGTMKGDVVAPRVVLADGARFKGSVDMESKGAAVPTGGSVSEMPRKTAVKA